MDFDKLLSEYLAYLKEKNPGTETNGAANFNLYLAEMAAKVCVSILKRYHENLVIDGGGP